MDCDHYIKLKPGRKTEITGYGNNLKIPVVEAGRICYNNRNI